MNAPIIYRPNFITKASWFQERLQKLNWVRRGETPRMEYYVNDANEPYEYGRGEFRRQYLPQLWSDELRTIQGILEFVTKTKFEVCFLNRYLDQPTHWTLARRPRTSRAARPPTRAWGAATIAPTEPSCRAMSACRTITTGTVVAEKPSGPMLSAISPGNPTS